MIILGYDVEYCPFCDTNTLHKKNGACCVCKASLQEQLNIIL
jgi:hypothetical protein